MKNVRPHNPPRWALRLFRWFCRPEYLEDIEGDLLERFEKRVMATSPGKANMQFTLDVIRLFRPGLVRSFESQKLNYISMLHHNFTISFRNFRRHKTSFIINIIGLSTGLASALFIYLWVVNELDMDGYHVNDDHLYQIMSNHTDANGTFTWKGVPGLLLDEINSTVPEVETAVATTDPHEFTLSVGDDYFKANGKFASDEFFDVFTFPLAQGNDQGSLSDKSSIFITKSLSQKLFKTTDAVGQQVTWHFWGKTKVLQVSGIMEDLPPDTSEPFDYIMSWDYYHDDLVEYKQWGNYYARIFLILNPEVNKQDVDSKVTSILQDKQESDRVELFLTKFSDRYLHGQYENGKLAGGRIEYVNLFSIIAIFILFIASINFINLSTAKASHRMKEIGIKKSMGASRSSLMWQYFMESIILGIISSLVAILLIWIFLPQFNFISQKDLTLIFNRELILALILLIFLIGVFAGSYPAFYLSGFKTLDSIHGKITRKVGEVLGRNTLVVLQFTLSIILIVAVVVVYQQMEFIQTKSLGYDRENLIYFEREGKLLDNSEAFVEEVRNIPGVKNAAISGFMVGGGNSTGGVKWKGKTDEDQIQFWETRSGHNTLALLGIELIEGRDFSEEFGIDTAGIIFNETAIAAMGIKDPIGKKVYHYDGEKTIIGVVKDFNLISLHTQIEPMLFLYTPEETHFIMARIEEGSEVNTIQEIQNLYESFNPGYLFKPQFIDQDYRNLYLAEQRVSVLSRYFAVLAILISCLGLFGLSSFTTERRQKEIGIRKILGSSIASIVLMISKDFTKMVLIAIVIALPIAYFVSIRWLENFAYTIPLSWWIFIGGAAALIIAWFTVSIQTFRAASINPSDCIRDE